MAAKRITELSNAFTERIDEADPKGMLQLLRQCNSQLFSGFQTYDGVMDGSILQKISTLANIMEKLLKGNQSGHAKNIIVFSGCGTSGRMGWLAAMSFNRFLVKLGMDPCFHYLISGGDQSLVISNELPEDDPFQGQEDLKSKTVHADSVLFIGITCGLSAPYVAGQIYYSMKQDNFTTVLIGFNPLEMARDAPISNWNKTCKQVFTELAEIGTVSPRKAIILNPIIGPEPITGSSRMKGGSMTKILMDSIFLLAIGSVFETDLLGLQSAECGIEIRSQTMQGNISTDIDRTMKNLTDILVMYQNVATITYRLIDCSEMVDTYGAELDEVRAFIKDGWKACNTNTGDLYGLGKLFHVSFEDFDKEISSYLRPQDVVIVVSQEHTLHQSLADRICSSPAKCALLNMQSYNDTHLHVDTFEQWMYVKTIEIPHFSVCGVPLFGDFALKIILNAITTGANIMKGRVYGNSMINLTVANSKLYDRAVDIVSQITGRTSKTAEACLKVAILREDSVKHWNIPLEELIQKSTLTPMVIPVAISLCGRSDCIQDWYTALKNGETTALKILTEVTQCLDQSARERRKPLKSLLKFISF